MVMKEHPVRKTDGYVRRWAREIEKGNSTALTRGLEAYLALTPAQHGLLAEAGEVWNAHVKKRWEPFGEPYSKKRLQWIRDNFGEVI